MAKRKKNRASQKKGSLPSEFPKQDSENDAIHELSQEFLSFLLIGIAIFIGVTNLFPNTTGLIGYWSISVVGQTLFGRSVMYIPYFIALAAILVFLSKSRRSVVSITLSLAFISFSILTELSENGLPLAFQWPPSIQGGGYVGALCLYALDRSIGIYGIFILIVGSFILSPFILLNVSIKRCLRWVKQQLDAQPQRLSPALAQPTSPPRPFISRLKYALFYSKRPLQSVTYTPDIIEVVPEPSITIEQQPSLRPEKRVSPDNNDAFDPDQDPFSMPSISELLPSPKKTVKKIVPQHTTSYKLPAPSLLEAPISFSPTKGGQPERQESAHILEQTLRSFNVNASVTHITAGPSVTRYELKPGLGVKISKITSLSKDIALKLAVPDVRIEAPIPGKSLIGIEVPNVDVETITLRTIIDRTSFATDTKPLICAMGLTITGDAILMDLEKMPHVLIAGATGSGKSVCINTIILSILLRTTPDQVRFLMIDPKKVELSLFEGIPHLLAPVVTDPRMAAATLKKWALVEMERRYDLFSKVGVKSLTGFNAYVQELNDLIDSAPEKALPQVAKLQGMDESLIETPLAPIDRLPHLVVVIDELADLMMVASQDVENTICRLAQMARATGIHLVVATQRPSVNVVTGLIKANIPSRISFFLQSQIDSRTILDMPGAEKLLGRGDMLYSPVGSFKPKRVQGVFVSEDEVKQVVSFWKKQGTPDYSDELLSVEPITEESKSKSSDGLDDLFEDAKEIVLSTKYASTSYLQRKLKIGYNRAARIMDELESQGVIGGYSGEKKSRDIIS